MVPDGNTIADYVAAAAAGAGRSTPDPAVAGPLDQLFRTVATEVGHGPVDRLAQNPHDRATRHEAGLLIDGAMSRNDAFAREVTSIVAELDRCGGRDLIDAASAGYAMPTAAAYAAGMRGGVGPAGSRPEPTHLVHWSPLAYLPAWAKVLIGMGFAVFAVGFVVLGYAIVSVFAGMDSVDPEQGMPAVFPLGLGVCAAGVIVLAIGTIGGQMSRRR